MRTMSDSTRRNTSRRGDLTELLVETALVRSGHTVLRPISSASRYDLLIDNHDGTFTRVQCKTGVLKAGAVVFRVCSVSGHRTASTPYHGEVDAFGVVCEDTGETYLVPMTAVGPRRTMLSLRVAAAKNGQTRGVHDAATYRIGR